MFYFAAARGRAPASQGYGGQARDLLSGLLDL